MRARIGELKRITSEMEAVEVDGDDGVHLEERYVEGTSVDATRSARGDRSTDGEGVVKSWCPTSTMTA